MHTSQQRETERERGSAAKCIHTVVVSNQQLPGAVFQLGPNNIILTIHHHHQVILREEREKQLPREKEEEIERERHRRRGVRQSPLSLMPFEDRRSFSHSHPNPTHREQQECRERCAAACPRRGAERNKKGEKQISIGQQRTNMPSVKLPALPWLLQLRKLLKRRLRAMSTGRALFLVDCALARCVKRLGKFSEYWARK